MAATTGAVLTGAIINIVVCLLGFLVFSILRTWKKAVVYYDPKRYTPEIKIKPAPLPGTLFGWIKPVFNYAEPDIIREAGLDTAIYLRLLSYGFKTFMWISLWCLIAVLPVNATGGECDNLMSQPDSTYTFTTFDHMSLANVPGGSMRMWMHVFSTYLISFILCKYLWQFSKDSVVLRIQFLANSRPSGPTHSVLVTDIPGVMEATNAGIKQAKSQELERKKSEKAEADQKDGKAKGGMGSAVASGVSRVALLKGAEAKDAKSPSAANNQDIQLDIPTNESLDNSASPTPMGKKMMPAPSLRQRKTYMYDLNDESLDPRNMAAKKLASGASPQELVHDEMELVYGDKLDSVQVVHDQSGLDDFVTEYHKRKRDLEDYLDCIQDRASRDDPLPPAKVTLLFPDAWMKERYGGGLMKKVDGLPFWRDRLLWLEEQILEGQAKAKALLWPSAFVTYKTRTAQAISATGLHQHDETTWRTQGAPEPRELVWSNLGLTSSTRSTKSLIWWVIFWLMTLFFMIPVVAIQGLIDVPKLSENVPGLSAFTGNVVVAKLIAAIVPGLVLKIFLALVPTILAAMMKASGAVSASEIDFGVVSRFFIFQVIVVFAGSTLGGSFFSQAQQWIADPGSVVSVLGTAIPQACTFFVTYIWVNIGAFPITFIRIVGLVLFRLFTWLASSPRARDRVFQEQYTNYGVSVTGHTMIILLGTVFCLINPIITPSVFVYFAIAWTLEKYNGIYIYRRNYESSGLLWVRLLNQVMCAMYIFQLVMIGLLAIKKFPYTVLIIPVIFPTIAFHMTVLNLYRRPWALMSLHDAAELDINDKMCDPETMEAPFAHDPEEYVSPVFKVYKGDLTALLAQAAEVEPRVQADVERRAKEEEAKKAEKKANKKGCF